MMTPRWCWRILRLARSLSLPTRNPSLQQRLAALQANVDDENDQRALHESPLLILNVFIPLRLPCRGGPEHCAGQDHEE